jgi:Nickel responsive protein SCO4226-like
MPTYMDVHDIPGVKAEAVAEAHAADVRVQGKYGVNYKSYWVNEGDGKVFCLVDAPDKESAARVHRSSQYPTPVPRHVARVATGLTMQRKPMWPVEVSTA